MKSMVFKAEMTINSTDDYPPGENFRVWYFKMAGKITTLSSTVQDFWTPEAITAEMLYAAESQGLAFSREADHYSATLAKYYYENVQLASVVLSASGTAFGRTVVSSLVLRKVAIDQLIANYKVPMLQPVHVDLVSLIADKATLHRDTDHDLALAKLYSEILIERRETLEEYRRNRAP